MQPITPVLWADLIRRWSADYRVLESSTSRLFLAPQGIPALLRDLAGWAARTPRGRYAVTGSFAAAQRDWACKGDRLIDERLGLTPPSALAIAERVSGALPREELPFGLSPPSLEHAAVHCLRHSRHIVAEVRTESTAGAVDNAGRRPSRCFMDRALVAITPTTRGPLTRPRPGGMDGSPLSIRGCLRSTGIQERQRCCAHEADLEASACVRYLPRERVEVAVAAGGKRTTWDVSWRRTGLSLQRARSPRSPQRPLAHPHAAPAGNAAVAQAHGVSWDQSD